jgi:diacylglycerol kinase family enzyme
MEGLALGRRSSLSRGVLWVYALQPCSRWQLLRMVLGLVLGRAPRESMFEIFSASHLTIDSKRRRIGLGIDGEMAWMKPPLRFESLPGALRVIAPSSYLPSEDTEG